MLRCHVQSHPTQLVVCRPLDSAHAVQKKLGPHPHPMAIPWRVAHEHGQSVHLRQSTSEPAVNGATVNVVMARAAASGETARVSRVVVCMTVGVQRVGVQPVGVQVAGRRMRAAGSNHSTGSSRV